MWDIENQNSLLSLRKLVVNIKGMKRIFVIVAASCCIVSCLKSSFSQSYRLEADFEYRLDFGKDSVFFEQETGLGVWYRDLAFWHKLNDDKSEFQGGFILSYLKGPKRSLNEDGQMVVEEVDDNFYRANSPTGMSGATYMVYHKNPDSSLMPTDGAITFPYASVGTCTMIDCWVTNTAVVDKAVREKFTAGGNDYLKLTAIGSLAGKETGRASINLAEYSAKNEKTGEVTDSVIYNWTNFDLSKLGSVDRIDFEIESSQAGIPPYFCMDYMRANVAKEW